MENIPSEIFNVVMEMYFIVNSYMPTYVNQNYIKLLSN